MSKQNLDDTGSSSDAARLTLGSVRAAPWALAGALACGVVVPLEPSLLEEGILLHIAQRLAHGEHLYRDVIAFSGPLPFEALAGLFRLFGEEIWVGRIAIVALHGLSTGLTYALATRATSERWAHLAALLMAATPVLLFPLYSLFYYTTIAFHLSLLATYAAARATDSDRWAVAAGVAVACTALSKQSIGAALAVTLGFALIVQLAKERRRRAALLYGAGGVVTALVTLIAFGLSGDLQAFWRAMIVLPLQLGDTYTSPFVNLWPIGQFSPEVLHNQRFYLPYLYTLLNPKISSPGFTNVALTQLCYALPLVAAAATFLARGLGRSSLPAVWFHLALLVAWTTNLFPRADWGHLAHVLPFALIQLVLVATSGSANRPEAMGRQASARGGLAVSVGAALLVLGAAASTAVILYQKSSAPSYGPRVPLRPTSQAASSPALAHAIAYLRGRTEPGEEIFVARAEPLLYFATDTRNPTPFPGIVPGMRAEQERIILPTLDRIRYVVMSDVDQPSMTYYRDELPAVQAHLERFFRVPSIFTSGPLQWLVVLERSGDRGPTAVDLIERVPGSRPFLLDESGREIPSPPLPQRLATQYNRRPLGFALGPRGGGVDFDLELPPNSVFQGSVGLRKTHDHEIRYRHPPSSTLSVAIRRLDAPPDSFQPIAQAEAMVRDEPGLRWTELEADLTDYAGQRVTLRLQLTTRVPIPHHSLGWWGSPRIATRPGVVGEGPR